MRIITLAFKSHSSGGTNYTGTVDAESRPGVSYPNPLGTVGKTTIQNDVIAGLFDITVDNGAVIPKGTAPTLTKPLAPAVSAPTGLTATATSGSQIGLTWAAIAGATGYLLDRSANGSTGWTQIATPTGNSYSDTGLTANTAYFYRLRAANSGNTSTYSNTANATTSAGSFPAYNQSQTNTAGTYAHPDTGSGPVSVNLAFTGAPKTDTNYSFSVMVQTTGTSGTGQGGIKVNGGSRQVTFNTEAADGGTRTITGTLSLSVGDNTITFEHVSGIWYQPQTLTVTRAAGA